MTIKFPCGICNTAVAKTHRAVFCDVCNKWVHIKCTGITASQYTTKKKKKKKKKNVTFFSNCTYLKTWSKLTSITVKKMSITQICTLINHNFCQRS